MKRKTSRQWGLECSMPKKTSQMTLWEPVLASLTTGEMAPAAAARLLITGQSPEEAVKGLRAAARDLRGNYSLENIARLRANWTTDEVLRKLQQAADAGISEEKVFAEMVREAKAVGLPAHSPAVRGAGGLTDVFEGAQARNVAAGSGRIPDIEGQKTFDALRGETALDARRGKLAVRNTTRRGLTVAARGGATGATTAAAGATTAKVAGKVGAKVAGRGVLAVLGPIGMAALTAWMVWDVLSLIGVDDRILGDSEGQTELVNRFADADASLRASEQIEKDRGLGRTLASAQSGQESLALVQGIGADIEQQTLLQGILGAQGGRGMDTVRSARVPPRPALGQITSMLGGV